MKLQAGGEKKDSKENFLGLFWYFATKSNFYVRLSEETF